MLLYYALGGGLGHITRAIAVLSKMDLLRFPSRLLASSSLSHLISNCCPCPLDIVPETVMSSRAAYRSFLSSYLIQHKIERIILDTFPFGLVGEWAEEAPGIPCMLLARYLKWDEYRKALPTTGSRVPSRILAIEELDAAYLKALQHNGRVAFLEQPIFAGPLAAPQMAGIQNVNPREECSALWAVVHSGPEAELEALVKWAKELMAEHACIDANPVVICPDTRMYPAESLLRQFQYVVSGTGYNMAAFSLSGTPGQKHFFMPFSRRYDDQQLRYKRLKAGKWLKPGDNGAKTAARWIMDNAL